MSKNIAKRLTSWWLTDMPLTSKRVRIILSNPSDANELVQSIRNSRDGKKGTHFVVSEQTEKALAK
jgi:hypothetical protein